MKEQKTAQIKFHTSPETKALLSQAAKSENKTVSEFLLDSGLSAASLILADRKVFTIDEGQWKKFQKALDIDPKDKPAFKKLLSKPGGFD